MLPGETILSGASTDGVSEFKVMRSGAGWYIGTTITEEYGECPYSRESGYFATELEASETLNEWNNNSNLVNARK